MTTLIYNPLEDYEKKLKDLHNDNVCRYFDELTVKSKVNIEENRRTVNEYIKQREKADKLRKKLNWLKALRVLMIILAVIFAIVAVLQFSVSIYISIALILADVGLLLLLFLKLNPTIKKQSALFEAENGKAQDLLAEAQAQMLPLNKLFSEGDALKIIEATIPQLSFSPNMSKELEEDMVKNYDLPPYTNQEQSTVEALSGRYNGNPFFFEKRLVHQMGVEVYHGYKTIHWTERYTDGNGKRRTRTRSQTLHATVTKPKPFYHTETLLNYGSLGAPELTFSRDATHLNEKSERQIERLVKKGEKKLKKLESEALEQNDDFMSMSNTDFEVIFDALDRTDEVQFRTMFTPLAQTNMVDLILSDTGYGDDFNFYKNNRLNTIVSKHQQGRALKLNPILNCSHSYDEAKEKFITNNNEYFKSLYFDFAPLLAIPLYQERPVHSLKPIGDLSQKYSSKEYETLLNSVERKYLVHPKTRTETILKPSFNSCQESGDKISVTAYSYDIIPQIDVVYVLGGDGKMHGVPVPWDQYIPLQYNTNFVISNTPSDKAVGYKNSLCAISLN